MPARATRRPTTRRSPRSRRRSAASTRTCWLCRRSGSRRRSPSSSTPSAAPGTPRCRGFPDDRGIRVAFMSKSAIDHVADSARSRPQLDPVQVDDDATTAVMGRGALHVQRHRRRHAGRPRHLPPEVQAPAFPGGRFTPRDEGERARFAGYALYRRDGRGGTVRGVRERAARRARAATRGHRARRPQRRAARSDDADPARARPARRSAPAGFDQPDQGDAQRLWNLAPLHPRGARRFSRRFQGRGELIDHILVSHALVRRAQDVDTGPGEPPSIDQQPGNRRDAPGSDHLPVVARFDLA